MKSLKITFIGAAILAIMLESGIAMAHPSHKWRLQFSGDSRTSGTIVLKFSPVGSDPLTVEISVPDNMGENRVARHVVNALKDALPSDAFHVERDDGEDVLIKARHGAANFDLAVVSNTVEHVRINPDRE